MLYKALNGSTKDVILSDHQYQADTLEIQRIVNGDYKDKSMAQIKGSGYIEDSLEAALWCFYHSENYPDAVLMAANLGDDADTTAAIVGQLAGSYYGRSGIPINWLNRLTLRDEIATLAERLMGG